MLSSQVGMIRRSKVCAKHSRRAAKCKVAYHKAELQGSHTDVGQNRVPDGEEAAVATSNPRPGAVMHNSVRYTLIC
jgi:hypothetical protein